MHNCHSLRVVSASLITLLSLIYPGRLLTSDGVHMNARGDEIMALGVLRALGADDGQLRAAQEAWHNTPAWVPFPKTFELKEGGLNFDAQTRIVTAEAALLPLAEILSRELEALTGKRPAVTQDPARGGDLVLAIDPAVSNEASMVEIDRQATIRAGDYASVAAGTVTLLQALRETESGWQWPRLAVRDEPQASYRGLLIDVARQWHSAESLKQIVELCRWYKIRYLQLHLTDDQSFTFPSTAYPKLATAGRHYTLDQLRDLENFARARGVVIVPEIETPGHATALVKQMPELFANRPPEGNVLCPGREDVYRALDVILGEVADVFRASPWLHIGADEVNSAPWKKCQDCQATMAREHLDGVEELYRWFIVRMNQAVKRHGKKMIVWEGFHKEGKTSIPRDITVMVFESLYQIVPDLIAQGYPVINTSWQPLYVVNQRHWSPAYIYGWNMYRWENWWDQSKAYKNPIVVEPTNLVLGAQMCAWEQAQDSELPSLRGRLPAMSERLWNPGARRTFEDFSRRFEITDRRLTQLLQAVR